MTQQSNDARIKPMQLPSTSGIVSRMVALLAGPVVLALGLQGCTLAQVATIKPDALDTTRGQVMGFTVTGTGKCTLLNLDWGDGSNEDHANVDFAANPSGVRFSHTYAGWGGNRIVTAHGVTDCVGSVQASVRVVPPFSVALTQPTSSACSVVPNVPPVKVGQGVHITTNNDPAIVINFGCTFGCSYNADGEANTSAPSNWPFPGLRKHSLILRIGTQVEQGGTDVIFTVHQAAPMEVCVNDDNLSDNTGAWGLFIDVHD